MRPMRVTTRGGEEFEFCVTVKINESLSFGGGDGNGLIPVAVSRK